MSEDQKKNEEEKKTLPRTYLSRGFLMPLEKDLYGIFRQLMQEDPETGQPEKVGPPLGPLKVLRPIRRGEDPCLIKVKTVHPKTGEAIDLVEQEQ